MAFGTRQLILTLWVCGGAYGHGSAHVGAATADPVPTKSATTPVTAADVRWLGRVTFGLDAAIVARFRQLGRKRFLDEQLRPPPTDPPELGAAGGANGEMQAANRNALSARGFEIEARRMAGLMRDKFNVAFIDVGGWDTHVNQGGAQGQLAGLLTNLGQGLAAFAEQMGPSWASTVVVVISEFGRTFRENGTRGTDHGHGSVYWVLGGSVHGGRLAGEQVDIAQQTLNQNRDWPVLTEYRSMLAGLFTRMYGLDATRLQQVFPSTRPIDIALL